MNLADLDPSQQAAVTHRSDRLRISAPPGSGKTRVLTQRVVHRVSEGRSPARTLVVTFTRQAADELKIRLAGSGVRAAQIGTLHSIALGQLRQRAEEQGRGAPRLAPPLHDVLAELRPRWSPAQISTVASAVARHAAGTGVPGSTDDAPHDDDDGLVAAAIDADDDGLVAAAIDDYSSWKAKRAVLDFDDLLAAWTLALIDDPVFGRAQRWRLSELFVDEFQDLTPRQFEAIAALLDDDTSLTVVGDPDQAIYGFNGADARLFQSLDRTVDGLASVALSTSYRCPADVLDAATTALGREPVTAARRGGRVGSLALADDPEEADAIAAMIVEERGAGREPGDIAVLARTHMVADRVGRHLARKGVPIASAGERTPDAVTLTTFHSAKGREWPVVMLAGVEAGLVPHASAVGEIAEAEERRLLYVAMTRAADTLVLSWANRRRGARDDSSSGAPSPWVSHIGTLPSRAPLAAQTRVSRSGGPSPQAAKRQLVDDWRTRAARRAGCDPDTIVSRRMVDQLVANPPTNLDDLCDRLEWGPALASRAGRELFDLLVAPPDTE